MDIIEKLYKIVVDNENLQTKEIIKEAIVEINKLRNKDFENQFMKRFMTKN